MALAARLQAAFETGASASSRRLAAIWDCEASIMLTASTHRRTHWKIGRRFSAVKPIDHRLEFETIGLSEALDQIGFVA